MNKYIKEFLHRGMLFGGFGPIIAAIIYYFVSLSVDVKFSGSQILLAVFSTYLLAFIQAGASVFNQIEHWPIIKSISFHLGFIYLAYLCCYLVNSWIPFNWLVILIFTAIFLVTYFVIWLIVFFTTKKTAKHLNEKIQ